MHAHAEKVETRRARLETHDLAGAVPLIMDQQAVLAHDAQHKRADRRSAFLRRREGDPPNERMHATRMLRTRRQRQQGEWLRAHERVHATQGPGRPLQLAASSHDKGMCVVERDRLVVRYADFRCRHQAMHRGWRRALRWRHADRVHR